MQEDGGNTLLDPIEELPAASGTPSPGIRFAENRNTR